MVQLALDCLGDRRKNFYMMNTLNIAQLFVSKYVIYLIIIFSLIFNLFFIDQTYSLVSDPKLS